MKNTIKKACRRILVDVYKQLTLKGIYPSAYKKAAKAPVQPGKVVFLELRAKNISDNFARIEQALKENGTYRTALVSIGEGSASVRAQFQHSIHALREIATAQFVFLNDSSSLISCIALRPETKVIQTWHGCGAFKKFGFGTAEKKYGSDKKRLLRFPMHKNFSYVTVSSPEVVWAYAEAFHMEERANDILPIGVSRTDAFFDPQVNAAAKEKLQQYFPKRNGRKVIVYAPTFRGDAAHAYSPDVLDLPKMKEALGEEYVLLFGHHPFVKKRPQIPEELLDFAADMTGKMTIEELLMVSDLCISDYSSLVFEYSLLERPMLFLAYDLEDYYDWRGFYYPYEEMTPGPIVKTTEEVIEHIKKVSDWYEETQIQAFREKFMSACDGHATERILELMQNEQPDKRA